MQIVSNQKQPIHRHVINRLIAQSDEIIICVAFLKSSGLDFIINKLKHKAGKCIFYIGTDYFLTEPDAVRELLRQGHSVFRTQKSKSTFHPKIYYFKKGSTISILTGSANITGGGLETNYEISLLIETKHNSTIDRSFKSIVKIYSFNSIDFNDEILISQYETQFIKYRQKHKKADKEFHDELKNIQKFPLLELSKYVTEYNADKNTIGKFKERTENYKYAKSKLNEITRVNISSSKAFLDKYSNIATKGFYSSGLLRGKESKSKKYKKIISIIRLVQQNKDEDAKILFRKALPLIKSVNQYGINALTEVMNTYNPYKYSVANGRTLKSLSNFKDLPKFPLQNKFGEETYERYNNLIIAIAAKCKFKNLGHVDHFLSWYYEKYVKPKLKK